MPDTAQHRIAALEAELAELRAEMQDFSYTVSHDLRASLRHILSYAQLVQEDAGPLLPQETQGFLHTISDSARHMGVLLDGLLAWSRLGTAPLQMAAVPLQPLLQDLVAELGPHYLERAIVWDMAPGLPAVQADATLLRTALLAVLDNALKFSAQRNPTRIAVTAEQLKESDASGTPQTWVRLSVQDNGAGFNPALQAKLFHPLQRLHTTKQFPGIGMGLANVRKIVGRLGGQVQIQGVVDAGCTLTLTLPAATE